MAQQKNTVGPASREAGKKALVFSENFSKATIGKLEEKGIRSFRNLDDWADFINRKKNDG